MDTHESYVSLEIAKLLKQVGFDWETRAAYWLDTTISNEYILTFPSSHDNWNGIKDSDINYLSVPTLAVAQRWLREVKKMIVSLYVHDVDYIKYKGIVYSIYEEKNPEVQIDGVGTLHFVPYGLIFKGETELYDIYEEALENGIKTCLTLLLKNKILKLWTKKHH